jgi:hypothetical protein
MSFDGRSLELRIEHPSLPLVEHGDAVPSVSATLRAGKNGPEFVRLTYANGDLLPSGA